MKINNFAAIATLLAIILFTGVSATTAANNQYSEREIRGIWTFAGWAEATLPVPFPAEIFSSNLPSVMVNPGDLVTVKFTTVGTFNFDGQGTITAFQDLIKAGAVKPLPPFPLPFVPPAPEQGHGTYTVGANGTVQMTTTLIDPETGSVAGEADYTCVLNRRPMRLDCIHARFKTFSVDPAGFDAPIVGQIVLRPQR